VRITDVIWKERFVDKLVDKHGVSTLEAEEVLLSQPAVRRMVKGRVRGEDVFAAMAQIEDGRHLVVFFINKGHGSVLPISARDMTAAERRYYDRKA
jgi:uncharacterized DUF497 family protein